MLPNKDVKKRYQLPAEVRFCTRCVVSNQRPRITFDDNGVCSACNFAMHKRKNIDWKKRENELQSLCNRLRKNDGSYDVIVPSSGGKDSAYVAHLLKYQYRMHPLTVTWAPHLYTRIGFKNFERFTHVGGFDNVLGTPNGKIHRRLTKLSFEVLGDPFLPFIFGQISFPLKMAIQHNVKLIVYGENGEVEYGGDTIRANTPCKDYRIDHNRHAFSGIPPEKFVEYGIDKNDLQYYLLPSVEALDNNQTEIHWLSYYRFWDPQENYYYAFENTGFEPNDEGRSEGTYSKYASLDDQIDGFHYYLSYIKFGLGRATSDAAHEIRDEKITRGEGVALVRRFDGEFPNKHFKTFLEYCDISEDYFWEVVDSWRSPHLWETIRGQWHLKHRVK